MNLEERWRKILWPTLDLGSKIRRPERIFYLPPGVQPVACRCRAIRICYGTRHRAHGNTGLLLVTATLTGISIAYTRLIRHGPHRKRRVQRFSIAAGTSLPRRCLATTDGSTDTPTGSPPIHGPHTKRRVQRFSIAVGTTLPWRCLATTDGYTDTPTDSRLIRHGPNRKRRVQQFFYCCAY
jgi:hypothetical protein